MASMIFKLMAVPDVRLLIKLTNSQTDWLIYIGFKIKEIREVGFTESERH